MPETIAVLRVVHVLLAVITVGANLTYGLWLRLAERDVAHLAFTIRGIRWIDRRVANPAYALLLVTGLALAIAGGVPLTRGWLALALSLYVAAAGVGVLVFGPVVRKELAALERGGSTDPEYLRRRSQAALLGVITTAIILSILTLMVLKPF